jgi:hypothetical protein
VAIVLISARQKYQALEEVLKGIEGGLYLVLGRVGVEELSTQRKHGGQEMTTKRWVHLAAK